MSLDIPSDFEWLLKNFRRYRRMAQQLVSPNAEDDELIRIAMVGFSIHSRTEQWSKSEFDFVMERRRRDYSEEKLAWYEETWLAHAAFACLCLGYLLGGYHAGKLTDEEVVMAESRLPAFLLERTKVIEG